MRLRPNTSNKHLAADRRRALPALTLPALALALVAFAMPASAKDMIIVQMDKAKLIKYPAGTETIIVGNPIVADVTMLKASGTLVVTGKGFGDTNLILLDHDGQQILDADLRVVPEGSLLTVQRGVERATYACHPRCQPTVTVGDDPTFMKDATAGIALRNAAAGPQGH